MKLIVGIDFGTSTTVVRYREEGSSVIQAVRADNGKSEIIPSAIFKPADGGDSVYGIQALLMDVNDVSGELLTNFKMDLLNPEKRDEAKANIVDFLTFVYSLFEQQIKALHPAKMDVYVSYPAKWSDDMVTFMKSAVETAGFKGDGVIVKGMKEPQAASLNMLNDCQQQLKNEGILTFGTPLRVLMLDMGAGTSDISIFKLEIDNDGKTKMSDLLSYPSFSEPVLCGGREIDALMQNYLIDMCKSKGFEISPDVIDLPSVKGWKESSLSPCLQSEDLLTGKNNLKLPSNMSLVLSCMKRLDIVNDFSVKRRDFEHLSKDHWRKLYGLIRSAFKQYAFAKPEDIDIVFLTGGHSNWYVVPNLFNGKGLIDGMAQIDNDHEALNFKKIREAPKLRMTDLNCVFPHESVARGLCLADEHVEFSPRSSNNVWAQISICGEDGGIVQIADKQSDLPITKHVEFETKKERNLVFDDLQFNAVVNVYSGEEFENAELKKRTFNIDEGSVLGSVICALFILPIFCGVDYLLNISMDVTLTEEGQLKINGTLSMDSKKRLDFTEKDLIIE